MLSDAAAIGDYGLAGSRLCRKAAAEIRALRAKVETERYISPQEARYNAQYVPRVDAAASTYNGVLFCDLSANDQEMVNQGIIVPDAPAVAQDKEKP